MYMPIHSNSISNPAALPQMSVCMYMCVCIYTFKYMYIQILCNGTHSNMDEHFNTPPYMCTFLFIHIPKCP